MSEQFERVERFRYLPIFPLPLVLMPNELLPLHIFEPRYRQMLTDIESNDNVFGVSFFKPGDGFDDRPAPGSIGCIAEVREVENLPDRRAMIVAVGVGRYELLRYLETGDEYLVAEIEFFEDDPGDRDVIEPLAREVFEIFKRVARAAFDLTGQSGTIPEIPQSDPETMSYLIAAALKVEPEQKQTLLEMRSTAERLERLGKMLYGIVEKMEETAHIQKISRTNGHSKKKIDY